MLPLRGEDRLVDHFQGFLGTALLLLLPISLELLKEGKQLDLDHSELLERWEYMMWQVLDAWGGEGAKLDYAHVSTDTRGNDMRHADESLSSCSLWTLISQIWSHGVGISCVVGESALAGQGEQGG